MYVTVPVRWLKLELVTVHVPSPAVTHPPLPGPLDQLPATVTPPTGPVASLVTRAHADDT